MVTLSDINIVDMVARHYGRRTKMLLDAFKNRIASIVEQKTPNMFG
jgi:hypothetical protein